ncbi:helix-turn-helix transcriptional regulator [Nitrincola sp. A-D6]|uniref:helix-turn-helix transcriptional regulator n=1 Tax=Nitrincola sp. A-D6 TaxID=1545442 RepID=UPI000689A93F|nr:AraC family transcriptional regulator [Nitrincola sp. A-D6]
MSNKTYNMTQELIVMCQVLEIDIKTILLRTGLPVESLENHGLNVSAKKLMSVFGAVVEEYQHDDYHIRLADGYSKVACGHHIVAIQFSETLREGIRRVAHFIRLLAPVDWIISESEGTFRIEFRGQSPDFYLTGEFQIMGFHWLVKCGSNVTTQRIVPSRVCITEKVPYQSQIEEEMGCPISIASTPFIEFPSHLMDLPVLSFNPQIVHGLDALIGSSSLADGDPDQLITNVHSVLQNLMPSGVVNIERVAERLGLSKRTLERRLNQNGLTFKEILRNCRKSMADHYVNKTQLSIAEISLLLGYSETNSFYRAFKEWYGHTPKQARAAVE